MTRFYVRCGDADGYNEFAVLSDVADHLISLGVDGEIDAYGLYGFTARGFGAPHNYISLYVGSDVETPTRELTKDEVHYVNVRLCERYRGH